MDYPAHRSTFAGFVSLTKIAALACIAVLQARLYQALGQESARDASLARARDLAGERPLPALAEPRPAMAQELGFRG